MMFRPRIIPVLLLKNQGLVKTLRFKKPVYVGDPINAVKIFNYLDADELMFLDISATNDGRTISAALAREIGDEAFMPFAVGGGIYTLAHARLLINSGAEKVVINSAAVINPDLIMEISENLGTQSLIVSIDVKKNLFGRYRVMTNSGKKVHDISPERHARNVAEAGAGEIIINSIDRDGTMQGYDRDLIKLIGDAVDIPFVACGGAGQIEDFVMVVNAGGASAAAAGSMFVFYKNRSAVLINYPEKTVIEKHFSSNES